MIRKSEYFEQADMYINSELTLSELKDFEAQLAFDPDLADEVLLQKDVEMAICEQDIINLRCNLNQIVQNNTEIADLENIGAINAFNFNLAEECSSSKGFGQISAENLLNIGSSFPKIHLYQHKVAGKENIHQFYKEQFDSEIASNDDFQFNPMDEKLFSEVQCALEESDIAELRANLKQVAQSMPEHQYSSEEIENYIYDRMDDLAKVSFEEELAVNAALAQQVKLIREIDLAVAETDIMDLRTNLNKIQHSEIQSAASIEDLENYINNELSADQLASFEAELSSNYKLREEIDLIKNINKALAEDDVMRLRSNLQNIASQVAAHKQNERAFAGKFNLKRIITSTVAASIIILLGFSGILSKQDSSADIYQKFYTKYEIAGTVRSADLNENNTFAIALQKYQDKNYTEALNLFGQVIANNPENMASHFYSGVSLQETGKYSNAIEEYKTVMLNKDNLFTEQAQWYTGLCLLQTNDDKKAYRQFKKIAESNGFYKQKATDILKKMKYSE